MDCSKSALFNVISTASALAALANEAARKIIFNMTIVDSRVSRALPRRRPQVRCQSIAPHLGEKRTQ
jgi:hypothetical protein